MTDTAPTLRQTFNLPPRDTVRAWEERTELRTSVRWWELWQEEHARAFTVAKVARRDILDALRQSLDEVIRNGGTFEQWQAAIRPELERAGWWGRVTDPSLTGTRAPVHVGPRRLKTIYATNLRVSRAAGQWARIQRVKDIRPYLRYVTVGDHRVRPEHRLWNGVVLTVDDPWWTTHFPPNGWNCRCSVIQYDKATLERRGWTVTKTLPPDGPQRRFRRGGKVELVPSGFDPGWSYNPGDAALRAIADSAAQRIARMAETDAVAAIREMREFARDPVVAFNGMFGRAGSESADDIAGFERSISSFELRHILRKHGVTGLDADPVTDADIELIPTIVADGRRVDQQRGERREQVFIYQVGEVFYIYVERVGRKAQRLLGRTLYKTRQLPPKFREWWR